MYSKKLIKNFILLLILFTFIEVMDAGVVYQYYDSDGVLHLSNKKPKNVPYKIVLTYKSKTYPSVSNSTKKKVKALIHRYAKKYNLDPYLIEAIAYIESGFNPKAVSPKGAIGVMQVMPQTAQSYGVKDIYNIEKNIEIGVKHFKYLLRELNDIALALAAYNAGINRVLQYDGIPPYNETINFVKNVINYYKRLTGKNISIPKAKKKAKKKKKPIKKYIDENGVIVLTNRY